MNADLIVWVAVILVTLTSTLLLVSRDWRYSIGALAIQYIGVFLLVSTTWPVEMAVTKMVAGWMAGAILGIAIASETGSWQESAHSIKFDPVFRFSAAIVLAITVTSVVIHAQSWFSTINILVLWGSFYLFIIGLLQLSLTSHPLRVSIGLLTSLSGFEIIYSAIETSVLVTGLLAGVNIGLALVGAYLLLAPTMEPS